MKQAYGFTLLESISEFDKYIKKQKPTRKIYRLQVHHTDLPNYDTWEDTDKKVYKSNPELGRTNSLDDYGKRTWGSSDGHGHYIAQHFTIFPNGKITTGRHLNSTPIGIKGWNSGAICIEIYGDFDKGKDKMTSAQKKSVIAVYAILCMKFKMTPSTSCIKYHAWFTSGGTCIGTYDPKRSRKTCPGTNFFGGNTDTAMKKNFLPKIKEYISGESTQTTFKSYVVRVTVNNLNVRSGPGTNFSKVDQVHKGQAFTIIDQDGNWGKLKSGVGWICLKGYTEKVK